MAASYLEYSFKVHPATPGVEILIAELGQLGFDSFVEEEDGLQAYIQKGVLEDPDLSSLFILKNPQFDISFNVREIEQVNWNAEWERNFEPIIVNDQCAVRAPFHDSFNLPYELIIEPKMSFGTGHHETTWMMMNHMFEVDLKGKAVLDMGCGTAVLAILAEKLGANSIDAVDIDEWSVENSVENADRNNCGSINVWQGDIDSIPGENRYDIILANINRNVLLSHIPTYRSLLNKPGILILSGFYKDDLTIVEGQCAGQGLAVSSKLEKNKWVAAKFVT